MSACQLLFVVEHSAQRRHLWRVLFCKRPESPVIHQEKGAQHEPEICAFKKKKVGNGEGIQPEKTGGMFHKSLRSVANVHQGKSWQKTFGKGRLPVM